MLYLTERDYCKILAHCRAELPNEACGLLGGVEEDGARYVKEVYLLTNIDASREHFSMDPREQLDAIKDMRAKGYEPLGNFHSHPESPSRPSEEDKRLAYDPRADYLILSLMDIENPVLHAFLIDEHKNVSAEELVIEQSGGERCGCQRHQHFEVG